MEVETYLFRNSWDKEIDFSQDSFQTLLLCFGNVWKYPRLKKAYLNLCKEFQNSHIIGCSTAGEIKDSEFYDSSLAISVIKFNKSSLKTVSKKFTDSESLRDLGKELIDDLISSDIDNNLKSIFILSDGININGSKLIQGINAVLRDEIILTGGLAGDEGEFKSTYIFNRENIEQDSVVAVGIYGENLFVKSNYKSGWDKFGVEREITSSKDNILYSLDETPALKIYKRYLGDYSSKLPASALLFPLSIRKDRFDDKATVRTILGIDEENQAMIFAGDIPEGYFATFMKANFDKLINSASTASDELTDSFDEIPDGDMICISVSCIGRQLVLKYRIEEELEAVSKYLPKNSHQIGFYSYGEISPLKNGQCALHNQTMTLTLIGEL